MCSISKFALTNGRVLNPHIRLFSHSPSRRAVNLIYLKLGTIVHPKFPRIHGSYMRQFRFTLNRNSHRLTFTSAPQRSSKRYTKWIIVIALSIVTLTYYWKEIKHTFIASQRSFRVLKTLTICIIDYRKTLEKKVNLPPAEYNALLKQCHKRCAERTLITLEQNGSVFIKLGQHLSSLKYLLPNEWCDTFIPLQDNCPVSSFESIETMILNDTGKPWTEFFSEIEQVPIGAASLAQVHRASLKDTGEKVAVKLQHPALDEWIPLDLCLTRFIFNSIKKWFPEYDLMWLSDEMEVSLPQELNFTIEASNAERMRAHFAQIPDIPIIIPKVCWAKRRILVMEYIAGHRPDDIKYLDGNGINREELSAVLARVFDEMIFGFDAPLHCDPHGGNLATRYNPSRKARWFGRNGYNFDIILYDHGLYRDIPRSLRVSYAGLWLSLLSADEDGMRKWAEKVSGIRDEQFPVFMSAITGREFGAVRRGVKYSVHSNAEREAITEALGDGLLPVLVQMLGRVPRVLLLILKTNDLIRSLDLSLQTSRGYIRNFLILRMYASRTIFLDELEAFRQQPWWSKHCFTMILSWLRLVHTRLILRAYEWHLIPVWLV